MNVVEVRKRKSELNSMIKSLKGLEDGVKLLKVKLGDIVITNELSDKKLDVSNILKDIKEKEEEIEEMREYIKEKQMEIYSPIIDEFVENNLDMDDIRACIDLIKIIYSKGHIPTYKKKPIYRAMSNAAKNKIEEIIG